MTVRCPTPLRAALTGLAAGATGTAAMTATQMAYMKATGGEPSNAPGEVGKRIIEGVFKSNVPEERMNLLNNVMHWFYGTSWGGVYGIVAGGRRPGALRSGLVFGAAVWGASLVHLPAMGLAPPPWQYSPKDVAPDLGFHLVYGLGSGTAYGIMRAG